MWDRQVVASFALPPLAVILEGFRNVCYLGLEKVEGKAEEHRVGGCCRNPHTRMRA